jgi:DNA gyrase/topoisomerase IV subunit B
LVGRTYTVSGGLHESEHLLYNALSEYLEVQWPSKGKIYRHDMREEKTVTPLE